MANTFNHNDKVVITDGGNVGIGTSNPASKLQIGSVGATNYAVPNGLAFGDGTRAAALNVESSGLNIYSTSHIRLSPNTTEQVRITTAGNVGIGTTNTDPLSLSRERNLAIVTTGTNAALTIVGGAAGRIDFGVGSTRTGGIYSDSSNYTEIFTTTALPLVFSTNSAEKMRITSSGALLVGTTSTTNTASGKIVNRTGGSSNPDLALNGGGWSIASISGEPALYLSSNIAAATGIPGATQTAKGGIGFEYVNAAAPTDLVLGIFGSPTVASSVRIFNNTERVRITSGGNVGIGTTSPNTWKLSVDSSTIYAASFDTSNNVGVVINGNDTTASQIIGFSNSASTYNALHLRTNSTSTSGLYINTSGNVGIGTTSPQKKLDVRGGYFMTNDGSGKESAFVQGGTGYAYFGNLNAGPAAFGNSENWTTLVADGGNVGIGTTSPDSKFHVEDTNPEVRITGTGGTSFPRLLWEYPVSATQASRWALTGGASANVFYLYNYTQSKKVLQVDGTASHITLNHDAAGTTQIGTSTTQTAYQLYVATNVGQTGAIEAAGSVKITSGALGVNIAASATAGRIDASNDIVAYSTSDKRLKENIKPLENATEKVKKLTGVEFDWKEEHKAVHGYEGHDVGVIAQEVQEVLPEAIRTNDSGYLSVRYEKMIALLIESNKELAARVEELEQKLKQ